MVEGSSALAEARKAWRLRNSDQRYCMDQDGTLVECAGPPVIELVDADLPFGAQTLLNPEDDEYVARVVLHQHVYSVDDPDA